MKKVVIILIVISALALAILALPSEVLIAGLRWNLYA
jgi:hypothetical protein